MTVADHLAPGPLMAALEGTELQPADRERLRHPLVGSVILFARNFTGREQVTALCREIHALRDPALLVAVDHEGGRVQRFRDGYTVLPPMRSIGILHDTDPLAARALARSVGTVIAAELRSCGVDLALAPVLDLDHGRSTIIGDRAFHTAPATVGELAGELIEGLQQAGMRAVGKHYPGHGAIAADSHLELPVDERDLDTIRATDLEPFRLLAGRLHGIMPAHVLYPRVDARPAGFSPRWIGEMLRGELGYRGAVFSDDLGMAGAASQGSMRDRASAALAAGCDVVLACTADGADELLDDSTWAPTRYDPARLMAMRPAPAFGDFDTWRRDLRYLGAIETLHRHAG